MFLKENKFILFIHNKFFILIFFYSNLILKEKDIPVSKLILELK